MVAQCSTSRGRRVLLLRAAALVLLALLPGRQARAVLKPEEVAVVAARGSRASEELAAYYLKARGIPGDHLCLIDAPGDETCPRERWASGIRPAIRTWLDQHDPDHKLRCLVTVWGIPLKIGPAEADPRRAAYRELLTANRRQRLDLVKTVCRQLDGIASDIAVPGPTPSTDQEQAPSQVNDLQQAQRELEKALQAAQARTMLLKGDELRSASARLQQLAVLATGTRVLISGMEKQLTKEPDAKELRKQYDLLIGRTAAFVEVQYLVDQAPLGYQHDALIIGALERTGGLLATIDWIDKQLEIYSKNETAASLDSELSLVLWPDDYELLRWEPNYLRNGFDASPWPAVLPTLMVCRIDAPTPELAKKLIDVAIATEKKGLQGKVYFDARGLGKLEGQAPPTGSYEDFDRALLATAAAFKQQTTMDTVLNESPELFAAGECPDAALYCGWYSLAKYVDAFEWSPGAVAYHLASGEAATLHDAGSQVWCKRMIEDGVAATLGPVYEPYLLAFPRPEQFFALLVKGDLTLVECYYRSLPCNSWMMTLIGDPLYRPFMNHTILKSGLNGQSQAVAAPAEAVPGESPAG